MGQGTEGETPPVETMYKINTRASRTASVSQSEGAGRRAASGSASGGEAHDHEEGFPAWERDQMEECLNEVLGHLGAPWRRSPHFAHS